MPIRKIKDIKDINTIGERGFCINIFDDEIQTYRKIYYEAMSEKERNEICSKISYLTKENKFDLIS